KVQVAAGQAISATTSLPAAAGSQSVDTYLRVFDAGGHELTNSYNDGFALFGYVDLKGFVFPTAGTYYVGVSANANRSYDPNVGGSGTNYYYSQPPPGDY